MAALQHQDVALSITVVECGSDGSADDLPPDVRLVDQGCNLGYAGGNNAGVASLPEDGLPVLLVNPDVTLDRPESVSRLLAVLDSAPEIGAVAPLLHRSDGLLEHSGSEWDPATAQAVHTGGGTNSWPHEGSTVDLPWLNGACLLVRRSTWQDVGGFDERFFLYFEESDWCLRATSRGWRLVLAEVPVTHLGSASFAESTKGAYYAVRNRHLLGRKHGVGARWRVLWCRQSLGLLKRSPRERPAVRRAMRDALLHRYGAMAGDARGSG